MGHALLTFDQGFYPSRFDQGHNDPNTDSRVAGRRLTRHANARCDARGISLAQLELVLSFGRRIRSKSSVFHYVGKREVKNKRHTCGEIVGLDGIVVLCDSDDRVIITTYRNHATKIFRDNRAILRRKRRQKSLRKFLLWA